MPITEAAPSGDIDSLYSSHHHWLRNWLRRQLNCSETAADLTHDTFIRILQKQRTDPSLSIRYPRGYLRMVANSLMMDHFRRHAVEKAYLEALAHIPRNTVISSEERSIILETLQQLDKLLGRLPSPVREAFLLSRVDGLTYAEIAKRLDVSLRTVKRYMKQAFIQCLDLML